MARQFVRQPWSIVFRGTPAYNAGAGTVAWLRQQAAKRGYDPNIWFRNVEYLAAEKIGAETVTYVSNIYKYFVAYTMSIETATAATRAVEQMKAQGK